MANTITERTAGGQEITIYENDRHETRMRVDFQGVELNTWDASVAMDIKDAREIHAALGKALAAYDGQEIPSLDVVHEPVSELARRVKAAQSALLNAQDAVDDVFYEAEQRSHLEHLTRSNECKNLRNLLIAAARLDGLTDDEIGVEQLTKSTTDK